MANVVQVVIRARDASRRALAAVQKRLGTLRAVGRRVGTAMLSAGKAIAGIGIAAGAAIAGLTRLASRGRDVIEVQRAFVKVVGDQEAALQKLRAATGGLVSDFELMVGFNKAIALGSADSVEQFAKMATTAQALGRALGIDTAFALESLNTGIARQSRLFLDNLGIIISVDEANRDYAEAMGIVGRELTDAERREAFRTAAMEAARAKVEELGGVTLTGADAATRFTTALKNFVNEAAELVAQSPAVAEFFQVLETGMDRLAERLPGILEDMSEFARTVAGMFDPVGMRAGIEIANIRQQLAANRPENREQFLRIQERFASRQLGSLFSRRGALERELSEFIPAGQLGTIGLNEAQRLLPHSLFEEFDEFRQLGEDVQVTLEVVEFLRTEIGRLGEAAADTGAKAGAAATAVAAGGTRLFGIGGGEAALFGGPGGGGLGVRAPGPSFADRFVSQTFAGQAPATLGAEGILVSGEIDQRMRELGESASKGADELENAGAVMLSSMGAMAQAAIEGSDITAQSVTGMIGNILQSIPGTGGFLDALIGFGTGIVGAFLGRDDNRPVPVRLTDVDDRAARKLEPRREGPLEVAVFLNGRLVTTSPGEARALLVEAERSDASTRISDAEF